MQKATIPSGGGKILMEARGNTVWIKLVGDKPETIRNPSGIPQGIPPSKRLPTDPTYIDDPSKATPFNPNQFPNHGNLIPTPSGSGEFEPAVPDVDNSLDPDFDPSLDPDFGQDPERDRDRDRDKPGDDERHDPPPDTPEDD